MMYHIVSSSWLSGFHRMIAELQQGSKVLEDQLKLMDEKYLELRDKLNFTRTTFSKTLQSSQKENQSLRLKYAFATNGKSLDHVKVPSPMSLTMQSTGSGGIPFDKTMPDVRPGSPKISPNLKPQGVAFAFEDTPAIPNESSRRMSQAQRPQSAGPLTSSPRQPIAETFTLQVDTRATTPRTRPQSSNAYQGGHTSDKFTQKEKNKAVSYLYRRIAAKDKSGTIAKEKWTADRLSELLQG
jgi:hypothetical protein